jgi:hypothetical protein
MKVSFTFGNAETSESSHTMEMRVSSSKPPKIAEYSIKNCSARFFHGVSLHQYVNLRYAANSVGDDSILT